LAGPNDVEVTMGKEAFEHFEVPPEMRAFAEKSVEQAKKAFDGFVTATNQAVSSLEGRAAAAQAGARDVTQKALNFAGQNATSSFDFVQKLVRAKDVGEVVNLHSDYVKQQIRVLSEQAEELGRSATRSAVDTAEPKKR
jgi:phasin